jgi:hypothetical protein
MSDLEFREAAPAKNGTGQPAAELGIASSGAETIAPVKSDRRRKRVEELARQRRALMRENTRLAAELGEVAEERDAALEMNARLVAKVRELKRELDERHFSG